MILNNHKISNNIMLLKSYNIFHNDKNLKKFIIN